MRLAINFVIGCLWIVELVRPHVREGIEIADAVRMAFLASRDGTTAAH
jgi:hypothetical protein